MKKIFGLTVAALLIIGMVGGGTWAYFSDTEESTGNTFTAGTLNLTADVSGGGSISGTVTPGDDGVNEYITLDNVKPGDSGTITWTCTNTGNLAGTLTMVSTVTSDENSLTEPETSASPTSDDGDDDLGDDLDGELDDYLGITLTRNGTYIIGGASVYEPLSELEAVLNAESESVAASGGTVTYVLSWSIASDVETAGTDGEFGTDDIDASEVDVDDNVLQSDDAIINITFTLEQS